MLQRLARVGASSNKQQKEMPPMTGPMTSLDQWDDAVRSRYKEGRPKEQFRNYGEGVTPVVREFYRLNHTLQTVEFNLDARKKWLGFDHAEMSVWDLMEELNKLVDDSDPDTDLSQIEHNLQTAEAMRADGAPRWMQLTGLIHDLGKVLWLWGEPQWAVVGDTFPVGCAWSDKIVFHEFFADKAGQRQSEVPDAVRAVRRGMRPQQRHDFVGTRRVSLPSHQGLPAGRGAVHDPVPLVLPGPSRG